MSSLQTTFIDPQIHETAKAHFILIYLSSNYTTYSSISKTSKNNKKRYKRILLRFADEIHDETGSESSSRSGNYSNVNYVNADDEPTTKTLAADKSTRFGPDEKTPKHPHKKSGGSKDTRVVMDSVQRLMRNKSLVDIRSQVLHRSLVDEVYKRRLFNNIGDVENIGFQSPYDQAPPGPPKRGSKTAKCHQHNQCHHNPNRRF